MTTVVGTESLVGGVVTPDGEHAVELSQLDQYPTFDAPRLDPRYEPLMRRFYR